MSDKNNETFYDDTKSNRSSDLNIIENGNTQIYPEIYRNFWFQENIMISKDNDENEVELEKEIYYIKPPKKVTKFVKSIDPTKGPNVKNKHRGRKKKGEKTSEKTHDKNSSDIIKPKLKRRFIQSAMNYINYLYNKSLKDNKGKTKKFLRKIKTDFSNSNNLKYFSKTLRQFFSSDLSGKHKKINKNYNRNNIDKLYEEDKEKDIIKLMNETLEEVFKIYISNKIPEFNLYNDLNEIKEKENEGNAYIDKFKKIALELIDKYKK